MASTGSRRCVTLGLLGLTGFLAVAALLGWLVHGTVEGVLGTLAFAVVGLLNLYPWVLPFVGVPLGILELLGTSPDLVDRTLAWARVDPSWLATAWVVLVAVAGTLVDLLVSVRVTRVLLRLRGKPKPVTGNFALVNCHVVDGYPDSPVIHDAVVLVQNEFDPASDASPAGRPRGGIIRAVGPASAVEVPPGYARVDLEGAHVLPGFINAHCHLLGSGKPTRLMNLPDRVLELGVKILALPPLRGIVSRVMARNARTALHAGVTTLRTMGDPLYLDVRLRDRVAAGEIEGPRLLVAGKGICVTGGHGGVMGFEADSPWAVRAAVRENVAEGVDCIKILSTGGVMDARKVGEAGRPQMSVAEIAAACDEAHRAGRLVATHCESTAGVREALAGGVDTIEHGAPLPPELLPRFRENPNALRGSTALVSTLAAGMGLSTLPISTTKITPVKKTNAVLVEEGMIAGFRAALAAALPLGVGTDASVPYVPHYGFWRELQYRLHYAPALSVQAAISHATRGNAALLGIADQTGTIEPGKSADLQVVPRDPLADVTALGEVTAVVVRGRLLRDLHVKPLKALQPVAPLAVEG